MDSSAERKTVWAGGGEGSPGPLLPLALPISRTLTWIVRGVVVVRHYRQAACTDPTLIYLCIHRLQLSTTQLQPAAPKGTQRHPEHPEHPHFAVCSRLRPPPRPTIFASAVPLPMHTGMRMCYTGLAAASVELQTRPWVGRQRLQLRACR